MGLTLPEGFPTDHITWESRGHYGPEDGLDPVSAPGALAGLPYSRAFRRLADGEFAVKGIAADEDDENNHCATVWHALRSLGPRYEKRGGMFNSTSHRMQLLDGELYYYAADYGFSGSPRLTLSGNRALRLICHRLGLKQPRRFPDEDSVPTAAELEAELLEQLRQESDGTSGEDAGGPAGTPKRAQQLEDADVVMVPIERGWAAVSRSSWNYINDQLDQFAAIAACSTWGEYRKLVPTDFDEMVLEATRVDSIEIPDEGEPFEVDLSWYEEYDRDMWLERGTIDLFESIGDAEFPWDKVVSMDTSGFIEPEHGEAIADALRELGCVVSFEQR